MQAAFKRQPANSVGSSEGGESSGVVDWDTVKAEDKALVHQVTHTCFIVCSLFHPPAHQPFTHLGARSLALTWLVARSLTHSLPQSLTHSLTHSLPYSRTHSLAHPLTHSHAHCADGA